MDLSASPLQGQVAVVTGAARGIGAAISRALAALGVHVVLTARDRRRLEEVQQSIQQAGGKASVLPCDLQKAEAIAAFANQVKQQHQRCDILVNCAGLGFFGKPLHQLAPEDWTTTFQVNLRAPYLMMRAFAPLMIEAKSGHILNISSLAGKNPLPNGAAYAASKWALNGLTYSVAEELRPHNIRVSVIAPGSVNTSFGAAPGSGASASTGNLEEDKAARKIQPSDVADVVSLLVQQKPQSFISEVLMRPTTKP